MFYNFYPVNILLVAISRALVTGGAGFIGGHIVRDLLSRGFSVSVVDNLKTGDLRNIPDSAEFHQLDCGKDDIGFLFDEPYDLIYHFAGQSSVEISYKDPLYDLRTNTESTVRILEKCINSDSHLIYASSMSVYGGNPPMPKSENSNRDGSNFYAIGKKASEDYLKEFHKLGVKTTSLRLFNIYGPGQNLSNLSQGMLSIYLAQALEKEHIIIKGSLDRSRDFVHIYDVLRFLRAIEGNPKTFGEVLNICTGRKYTVLEVIQNIQMLLGDHITYETKKGTPGDIDNMLGDASKLISITSIEAEIDLKYGIKTMIESLASNEYYSCR